MNEPMKEKISALVDDELSLDGLNSLRQEQDFASTWQRYHLIRDAIKDELSDPSAFNLADKVRAALENEPTIFAPSALAAKKRVWPKAVAGLAIAATVAAVSVLGMQQFLRPQAAPESLATVTPVVETAPALAAQEDPAEQQRLKEYLIEHSQQSIHQGNNRVVPYVQAASFQDKK